MVLTGNQIRGGDAGMFYTGAYSQTGNQMLAQIRTGRHSLGYGSVFGRDDVVIDLRGTVAGDAAVLFAEELGAVFQVRAADMSATLAALAASGLRGSLVRGRLVYVTTTPLRNVFTPRAAGLRTDTLEHLLGDDAGLCAGVPPLPC